MYFSYSKGTDSVSKKCFKKSASLLLSLFLFLQLTQSAFAEEAVLGANQQTTDSSEQNTAPAEATAPIGDEGGEMMMTMSSGGSISQEGGSVYISDSGILSGAPDVDAQTGAYTYSYPIVIPPGRNNLTPELSLNYNSNDRTVDSIVGYGWSIPMLHIHRLNKTGIDNMYTSTNFQSELDGELVTSNGIDYSAKFDKGSAHKYSFLNNRWVITDKNGTRYSFGSTTASQFADVSSSTRIYGWYLDEIRDTNDNYIKFEYVKDKGKLYLSTTTYTGYGTTDGIYTVTFVREARPDTHISYTPGFVSTTTQRISEIKVAINGSWVRKYALGYGVGENNTRSVLTSITESGNDSQGVVTLPATTFGYSNISTANLGWSTTSTSSVPERIINGHQGHDMGVRFLDVNGDGYADLTIYKNDTFLGPDESSIVEKIYINKGSSWELDSSWTFPRPVTKMAFTGRDYDGWHDTGARFADVDGDGYTDIVWSLNYCFNGWTCQNFRKVYINNRVNGWTESTTWSLPGDVYFTGGYNTGGGNELVDVNGDGLVDIVKATRYTINGGGVYTYTIKTYLNTGSGWVEAGNEWDLPQVLESQFSYTGAHIVDLNSDGLADLVHHVDADYSDPDHNDVPVDVAYINTGRGWVEAPQWKSPVPFVYKFLNYGQKAKSTRLMDLNGDGLLDIFANDTDSLGGNLQAAYINTGNGWSNQTANWNWASSFLLKYSYSHNGYWITDAGVRFVDFDGDNMVDMVANGPTNTFPNDPLYKNEIRMHSGEVPDLLTQITSSYGGTTTSQYTQSAQYKIGGKLANASTSMNVDTVSKVTHDSLNGNIYSTNYFYEDGHYFYSSTTNRQFAGFGKVTTATALSTTTAYYHQGNGNHSSSSELADSQAKIGKSYRIDINDRQANLYKRTITKWDTASTATTSTFVYKSRELTRDFDGDSDTKDSGIEYVYNSSNGNLSKQIEWGEVSGNNDGTFTDTGTDKRTTQYGYATNTSAYIIGLPSSEVVLNQSGNKVRESRYYYDSQPLGTVTKGNRTKDEHWVASSSYASSTRAYNSYGLVTSETDPRGKTTTHVYDTYNLYPATSTNPLGQSTKYTYDYSSGKVMTTTDPNGLMNEIIYDGLDRVIEEKAPDPTTGTLVTKTTNVYSDGYGTSSVLTINYRTSSSTASEYRYLDGFGREIQKRSQAEDGGTYIAKDTIYGINGLVSKESLPYFSSGASRTTATSSNALFTTYSYDPLGRVASSTNAVGTTLTSRDQWKETVTDVLGKIKDFTYDAYGRLTKVTEHNSAATYNTSYQWNPNNNLTKVTDALGNLRTIAYDGLSRRTSLQDLHAPSDTTFGTWTFAYDNSGNLTTKTDPKNQVISYTYDNLNRPLTENYAGQAGTEITYVYDSCTRGVGRLCTAKNNSATTTYTYNYAGLPATEAKTIGTSTYSTSYAYDRLGNQTLITYPDNSEVRYTFNTANLLEKVEQKENGGSWRDVITDFDYAPTGQITYQEHANGTKTIKTYAPEELYRLRSIVTTASSTYGTGGEGGELAQAEVELFLNGLLTEESTTTDTDELEIIILPIASSTEDVSGGDVSGEEIATTTETVITPVDIATSSATSTTELPLENDTASTATTTEIESDEVASSTSSSTLIFGIATSTALLNIPLESALSVTTATSTIMATSTPSVLSKEELASTDRLVTNVHEARVWQRFHTERLKALESNPAAPQKTVEAARYAKDRFDNYLLQKGYTKEKGGAIKSKVQDVIKYQFKKGLEVVAAAILPDKAYAYLFGVEDFENCSSLPCSFNNTSIWGSVTGSLDHTSKVEGEDSFKTVVSGESQAVLENVNYNEDEVWVQLKIFIPSGMTWGPSGYFSILRLEDSGNGYVFGLNIEDWGVPRLSMAGDPLAWSDTGINLTAGAVNTIEVRFKKGTTNGDVDIWVNNTTQNSPNYNGSGTMNTGNDNVDDVKVGIDYAPEAGISNLYFDDMTIDLGFIGDLTLPPSPPFDPVLQDTTYTYDAVGNITRMVDESATSTITYGYEYDDLYRLTKFGTVTASSTINPLETFTYDALGNILTKSTTGSYSYQGSDNNVNTYYIYNDSLGSGVDDWSWNVVNDPNNTSPTQTGPNSLEVDYTVPWAAISYNLPIIDLNYYKDLELAVNVPSPTNLDLYLYFYDDASTVLNIVNIEDYITGDFATSTWHNISIPLTDLGVATLNEHLTFTIEASVTTTVYYDNIKFVGTINTPKHANPHAPTTVNGISHTYDQNGNLTTTGPTTHTYTYNNYLNTTYNTATTTYSYDHQGQRVQKTGNGITTIYPSNLYELTATNTTKHIYGNNLLLATIKSDTPAPKLYHNHLDHLDSTKAVTTPDGYLNQELEYYPFGQIRLDNQYGDLTQSNQYIGQNFDQETDLSYLNARYYDGERGQFLSQDPSFLAVGGPDLADKMELPEFVDKEKRNRGALLAFLSDPQLANSYGYARNNPITYKDPNGNCGLPCIVAAILAGVFLDVETTQAPATSDEELSYSPYVTSLNILGFLSPGGYSKGALNAARTYFQKESVQLTEHALGRVVQRSNQGITPEGVVNSVKNGEKFFDKLHNNTLYIKDGIRVSVDENNVVRTVVYESRDLNKVDRFVRIKKDDN